MMNEEDFFEYMSRLWSMVMWGNKRFVALKVASVEDYDLLAVDYFLWDEVLPLAEKRSPVIRLM